ncbi:MAG: sulfite exporter TauE/SafE family protein, partial [Planctomycetota bacterium]
MLVLIVAAILVGMTLGLLGSGGSAITVPLLVYVVGHSGKPAIAESLAIVGTISLFSMISYARSRCVNGTCVACFGLPGMLGTFLGAGLSDHVSTSIQLTVFGAVLLLAAFMMIRKAWAAPPRESAAMDASTADALTA